MQTIHSVSNDKQIINADNFHYCHKPHFEVLITQDPLILNKAKKLRLKFHANYLDNLMDKTNFKNNTAHSKNLIKQQQIIIHDGYDSFAEHLVVIDKNNDHVAAYVRLIDTYTAYKIGGYYCETRFNLNHLFNNQTFYMEISRLVLDQAYNNKELASLVWNGIIQHSKNKGIDAIIGSLSLTLEHEQETYALLNQLKTHHISSHNYRVSPYQILPDKSRVIDAARHSTNPFIDYFFQQGVKLCGDAYWNRDFNCAELFIHYPFKYAVY